MKLKDILKDLAIPIDGENQLSEMKRYDTKSGEFE